VAVVAVAGGLELKKSRTIKEIVVIPAQAGIHLDLEPQNAKAKWIPAFAGMTDYL
jgi:hypothetical protein